ncbi:hypothetical protein ACFYE2_05005 [Kocuria sp. CPCC 205300]|uniref:hypothetical protein n=1 Tax=Kocuria sabuli TaxID=3071448 RepID=UPI0036DA806A
MITITSRSGDVMAKDKQATGPGGEQQHRILDKLNQIAMRVYGPGDHSPHDAQGESMSQETEEWYQNVQEHFYVEKDQHGNEYLYHKDDSPEGPRGSTERNW